MNVSQTIFTIFYGIYFAAIVGLTGPLLPFDTPSMFKRQGKAWLRFIVSFFLLNIVPVGYFLLIYHWLDRLAFMPITFFNILILLLLSLGGFAFYRVYWGLMFVKVKGKLLFYHNDLPKGLTEKIKNHPLPEAAGGVLPNIIPGLVWILCNLVIGWFWSNHC